MANIDRADLRDVDLNLLVAFEALMQTRSVSRMAQRLRIGQPSASHALKRLRALLGDPLFVRTPAGMIPTPHALALAEPIRAILTSIERTLFARASFDPRAERRVFRIGAMDYVQAVIADPLLAVLQAQAPGCKLILTTTDCDTAGRSLARGEIDLAIGAFPQIKAGSHQELLYRERYECVFDAKACRLGKRVTRAQWLALPHVIMSVHGDYSGPLDDVLKSSGEQREVAVSTPNFLAIPFLLRNKRLIAALPSRMARAFCGRLGLSTCPLPFTAPTFDVTMIWHARTGDEPGAAWLRDQITAICRRIDAA
ncbi:putative transcriptional regulator, LysR family [Bradyrhizobium sp. ORS 278]|uniref:LysR family transcriptional regulator n=1 Tax=Bradyrhizobium sp. (strain ORS 278) TaxID=114615 RepID=UPI0001507C15|nr:LysR family transcriptional regulator [Bradyrhizobium sp. ORS 278]CAL75727.1 putative transcriptional regulator, LysR family [Bradyrhizobium sp. ORS 278]